MTCGLKDFVCRCNGVLYEFDMYDLSNLVIVGVCRWLFLMEYRFIMSVGWYKIGWSGRDI